MPFDSSVDIVRLREHQVEAVAGVLARAFHKDPLAIHMLPNQDERSLWLPLHFEKAVLLGHLFGEVYTTSGDPLGAAIWYPPDRWQLTPEQLEEASVGELAEKLPEGAFERFLTAVAYVEMRHKKAMPEPHWYLAVVGVDRNAQGTGIGGALIEPVLEKADCHQLTCYLETAEAENERFYSRLGFTLVAKDVEPSSGLDFWTFRRNPIRR